MKYEVRLPAEKVHVVVALEGGGELGWRVRKPA